MSGVSKFHQLFVLIFSIHHIGLNGQFVMNGSFEGQTGFSIAPAEWYGCNANSTPDTGPSNSIDVINPPSNGNSYLHMVLRSKARSFMYYYEDIETHLLKPLLRYGCYTLSVDLAYCETEITPHNNDTLYYNNPVKLKIYGGKESCERTELLVFTGLIDHNEWQNYSFSISPELADLHYLILEVNPENPAEYYYGNIIIDNLIITKNLESSSQIKLDTTINGNETIRLNPDKDINDNYIWYPPDGLSCNNCRSPLASINRSQVYTCQIKTPEGCYIDQLFKIDIQVFIPNIITPNNDGFNDVFRIDGLEDNTRLVILNRLGQVVFQDNAYQNQWNGINQNGDVLKEGTYWYVLNIPNHSKPYKGFVYLKP